MSEGNQVAGRAPSGGARERLRVAATSAVESFPVALGIVVLVGLVLRLVLSFGFQPALLSFADTAAYIRMADEALFADPARMMGYPLFVRVVHAISPDVETLIQVQHLIGIATGIVLYATVRRVGAPVWAAVVAAAAVLLSIDQIALEHTVGSESLFTFVFAVCLYCCVRSLDEPRTLYRALTSRHAWLVAAGLLLGLSAWVRGVTAPIVPFLGLWALLAFPGRFWARVGRAAIAVVPAAAMLLVYSALNEAQTGTFGLNRTSGWAIYSRAAPFADCDKFEPPAGTEELCESKPPQERPGPDFYTWQADSPAQKAFGYPPTGNEELGEFGRAAILGQPFDYLKAVTTDFFRFFVPTINQQKLYSGADYTFVGIDYRDPPIEQDLLTNFLNPYFEDEILKINRAATIVGDLQPIVRVHPIILLQAILIAAFSLWWARGRVRAAIALLGGAGVLLILVAAATGTYNARYAIPADGPLVAAAAIGAWVLIGRLRAAPEREPGDAAAT